jgi:hypothetical protein
MDSKREPGGGVRGVLLGIPHDVANGGLLRPSSVLRDVGGTCGDPRAVGRRWLASEMLSEEGGASMSNLRVRPEWCASAQERLSGVWQHASAHRRTGGPREAPGPFDLVAWGVTDSGRSLLRRICDALGAASGDGRVRLTTFMRRGKRGTCAYDGNNPNLIVPDQRSGAGHTGGGAVPTPLPTFEDGGWWFE